MIRSVLFVSQAYLSHATTGTLERAAAQARLSIVLHSGEELHPRLAPYMTEVHRLTGTTRTNLQPAFGVPDLTGIAHRVVQEAGGDPARVALFCQHEDNVLPAAEVRARTGIRGDGPGLVMRFRDKVAMKEALAPAVAHALPRYRRFSPDRADADPARYYGELATALGTPDLVVKPTSGAGSLNVTVVSGPADLASVARRIRSDAREFQYEVDEFLHGTMHQCDSFVRDGKVVFCGVLELGCSNFDFVQGRPLSVHPVTDRRTRAELLAFNQAVVDALGFRDGSTHHELFVRRRGDGGTSIKFVEIAARVPGGLGVPFHERNAGVNLIDANLRLALGDDPVPDLPSGGRDDVVAALLPVGHGTVVALHEPDVASDYSIDWRIGVGDVVDSRSLIDNAGILTLTNDDPGALRRDFESLQKYVPVTCE